MYAAGFPLGDPEYTLTRGIVSKAQGLGETSWASIDYTMEHDAAIQPGNSGGPLVAADGTVVGINYAGGSPTNTEQFFAIDSTLAQKVVEKLKVGDFESLGINGQIVNDEEAGITGLWVLGVAPGSAADDAGIASGDIVTKLNGLPIGEDGSMGTYCDVIRTSGAGKPIDVEVLRFDTSEVLEGQFFGDGPIEPTFSFAEEIEDEVVVDETDTELSRIQRLPVVRRRLRVDHDRCSRRVGRCQYCQAGTRRWKHCAADHRHQRRRPTSARPTRYQALFYSVLGPVPDVAAAIEVFAPEPGACLTDGGLTDYERLRLRRSVSACGPTAAIPGRVGWCSSPCRPTAHTPR